MSNRWTKGPWVVIEDDNSQISGYPCIDAKDYTVVGSEGMFGNIETDYANAYLISAAPDLYDALEGLRKWIFDPDVDSETEDSALATFEKVDAALAKARGE